MPASPLMKTTCPNPALLCSQRRRSSPLSSSRPTRSGAPAATNSSSWLGIASRPRTRLTAMGSATPWSVWVPMSSRAKVALHQPCRHGTNHHRIGRGETFEPRRDVGRFPERQVLVPPTTSHHPHHNRASVDAEPHGELDTVLCRQTGIQGGDGLDNAQAGMHGTPGIVFMGRGVAKIDQQPIAEVLGDMALVVLDDLGRGLLVGAHHGAQVFRVELAGELRGAHQVTEQHRELPAFRFGGRSGRRLDMPVVLGV